MCESPAETGLYYLKSRYYDPSICRFINADSFASTGQGFVGYNMFAYCNDNPVNMKDSKGIDAIWIQEGDSAGYFGHSGLMIQDENGNWFYFYWGPEESSLSFFTKGSMILGGNVMHHSYLIPIDITGFAINNSSDENISILKNSVKNTLMYNAISDENRYNNISSYYYFTGEFTDSLLAADEATKSEKPYN